MSEDERATVLDALLTWGRASRSSSPRATACVGRFARCFSPSRPSGGCDPSKTAWTQGIRPGRAGRGSAALLLVSGVFRRRRTPARGGAPLKSGAGR